jgi:hypothetical protein
MGMGRKKDREKQQDLWDRMRMPSIMVEITREQERQVIDDLTALDWTRDLESRSIQLLTDRIGCSLAEAALILEQIEAKGMIERASESGGQPAANRTLDSYGWKWVRK